jgi:hypothetical protein
MTLFAENIPKHHGAGFAFEIIDLKFLHALQDLRIISAGLTQPREIALHVRHKDWHATRAEILCQRLKRDRFSRAGGTGDQTMAVRHFGEQKDLFLRFGDEDGISHGWTLRFC